MLSLVAGLALMVTAMVGTSRLDMQMLYAQRDRMQAAAYFDGVAHLLLREYRRGDPGFADGSSVVFDRSIEFAGKRFECSVYPLDGLMDVRTAPANLLEELFVNSGSFQAGDARSLASAIVRYREQGSDTMGAAPVVMDSLEDLMDVPGMRREVLDQLGFAMRASGGFSPAPNPGMLPAIFAGMLPGSGDFGGFAPAGPASGVGSSVVQLTMSYETESGRVATGHYRVNLQAAQYGIPWRVKRRFPTQFALRPD